MFYDMIMRKVFIYVSGCERRELDATRVKNYFIQNGHKIVNKPKHADVIFYITCDLLDKIGEINLNKIKEFQKYKADLIVAGCLPDISKEKLLEIFDGHIITTKDLNEHPEKIDKIFPENKIPFSEIEDGNYLFPPMYDESKPSGVIQKLIRNVDWMKKVYFQIEDYVYKNPDQTNVHWWHPIKREFYHIRTSWGCPSNCSYCAIKKAIGEFKSKPLDKCLAEFKKGLDEGFKLFFINADDIGGYGIDINSSFTELLDKLTSVPGDYQLAIRSLNPPWVVKYIDEWEEILKRGKIVSMEIPVQSGSQRILKLMRRYSNVEKMIEAFKKLKQIAPDMIVYNHYIAGFPTETEEDFKQTLNFIVETKFKAGTIFPYSCKTGTDAEKIEPKIPRKEVFRWLENSKPFLAEHGYKTFYRAKPDFFIFYS